MGKMIRRRTEDRLTPGEVAVLSRVVRAIILPETELVSSWGMGPWAAEALDGLLRRKLVNRHTEVDEFIGRPGLPSKPGPWIIPTPARKTRMPKEVDVAFPPSGNWISYAGLPPNHQPPDLLMQLLEYFDALDGATKADDDADMRPAAVLNKELMARISEIKMTDDRLKGGG